MENLKALVYKGDLTPYQRALAQREFEGIVERLEIYEKAVKNNAVLPHVSNWLSFPENKPEQFSWVLVTIKSPIDKWVEMAGFDGEKFQLPGRGDTSYVTHWMPIPEPACC